MLCQGRRNWNVLVRLNMKKHHTEFESVLSVWWTDVLTTDTNDACNSPSVKRGISLNIS